MSSGSNSNVWVGDVATWGDTTASGDNVGGASRPSGDPFDEWHDGEYGPAWPSRPYHPQHPYIPIQPPLPEKYPEPDMADLLRQIGKAEKGNSKDDEIEALKDEVKGLSGKLAKLRSEFNKLKKQLRPPPKPGKRQLEL